MTLWVPDAVMREQLEQRREYEARLESVMAAEAHMRAWNEELKQIDPYLQLVRVKPQARELGLKPGYWYVMRHNPGTAPHVLCVEDEETGEYREPDARLFQQLREWDCWDDRVMRDREKRRERIQKSYDRQKAREREERMDEANILFKALESPGIRFGGSWTAKAGARKG